MKPFFTATWSNDAELWYVTRHEHAAGSELPQSTFVGKCSAWNAPGCEVRALIGAVPAVRVEADSLVYDTAEPGMITFLTKEEDRGTRLRS